jgi:ketosteroid isomerase-like protein
MLKKIIFLFFCSFLITAVHAQSTKTEKAIYAVMDAQEIAWNNGDLEAFMAGYWRSDSLCFIGSRGLTRGWSQTLSNYQKGYATRAAMGTLTFTILKVEPLSKKSAFVIGKWHLKREKDELSGYYSLLWKKINGHWLIVADHSS